MTRKNNLPKFDYQTEVLQVFQKNADPKLKDFNNKLTPGGNNQYGLSIPFLRKLAQQLSTKINSSLSRQIAQEVPEKYYFEDILSNFTGRSARTRDKISDEEKLLLGLIIAYLKIPLAKKFPYIKQYVPFITSWAICDSFVFKVKEQELKDLQKFLEQYFKSNQEFEIRFGITMGMKNFLNENFLKSYLDCLIKVAKFKPQPIKNQDPNYYYVDMALAWALAEAYIRFPERTLPYLDHPNLTPQVRKFLLQKLKDSFRVSKSDKEKLAKLLR